MSNQDFVYTTYIRSSAQKVWRAITNPEFTRAYWAHDNVSDWKPGSKWSHVRADASHTVDIQGKVVESEPPRRLVITWARPADEGNTARTSRVTFEIEPIADMVRLIVTHADFKADADMARSVSWGWPRVLASLKSFLETGTGLDTWAGRDADKSAPPRS